MLTEIIGLGMLAATLYLKVKTESNKSGKSWEEKSASEKCSSITKEFSDSIEERKQKARKKFKSLSDSELKSALNQCKPDDWRYPLLKQEARSRNIE